MASEIFRKGSKSEPVIRFEPSKPTQMDNNMTLYFRGIKAATKILQKLPQQYISQELIHQISGPRLTNVVEGFYSRHAENTLEKIVVTLFEMRLLNWANKNTRSLTSDQLKAYHNASWLNDKMMINGQLNEDGKILFKKLIDSHEGFQSDIEPLSSLESLSDDETSSTPWVISDYQPRNLYLLHESQKVEEALQEYDNADRLNIGVRINSSLIQHSDGFIEKVSKKR